MSPRVWVLAGGWLALAGARAVAAQAPAEIGGHVVDGRTSAAIGGAAVEFGDQVVRTTPDGRFHLAVLQAGDRRLVVRAVGYVPDTTIIAVTPGITQGVLVSLRPAALMLAPLVATAIPAGAEVLSAEEVRARGADLATALDGWAGVAVRRTGAMGAAPQVRGSAPEEVLVLLDGVPLNDPLTGRADLSRIPTSEVRRVVLEPGAQTARAGGRALAGVIDVVTRAPASVEAATAVGSYGARSIRGGAGVVGIGIGGSWQRLPDDYPARNRDGSPGTRTNAGGTVWDAYVRHQGRLAYAARASGSDRGLPGNITNPSATGRASDRSLVVSAGMAGVVHWDASAEWLETRAWDPDAPPLGTSYDVSTRSAGGGASIGVQRTVGIGGWTGTADVSADGRYDRFSGDAVAPGAEFGRGGARLSAELARGGWSVSPVVRADGWSGLAAPILTGRLDAAWQGGGTVLSFGLGSGVAPPVPFDLLFRDGVGVAVNPGLRPERVRWELTADLRRTGRVAGLPVTASVRGFVGRVDDLVVWAAGPNFVWSPHNVDVRRRGGEAQLDVRPLTAVTVSAAATVSFVNYANALAYPVAYRPRDTERLSATWAPAGWRMDLTWRRLGPRPQANNGQFNLPAIVLLDAGLERAIGRAFLLRLDATDLGDQRPEYIAGLPLPGRSLALTFSYGGS